MTTSSWNAFRRSGNRTLSKGGAVLPTCLGRHCAIALVLLLALCGVSYGAPGNWPEPRHNGHLTAIQPLPGKMDRPPQAIARYDLGKSLPRIVPVATGDEHRGLAIVAGALHCYDVAGSLLWKCHPPGLNFTGIQAHRDLDGDGAIELVLHAGRSAQPFGAAVLVSLDTGELLWRYDVDPMSYSWHLYAGRYLPERDDEQLIVVMHGYPPDKENGYIVLFEYPGPGEQPVQRWRYDFHEYTCFPSLLQTDLDGDGVKELVVETHSRMWFLDALTGEVKDFVGWDVSPANVRSYGLVRFVDLNADGHEDFLCIGDFATHHEVLLNSDGKMELAWAHGWAENVTTGKVATCWPEPPHADVDGDGDLEILVNMFNSEGGNAWLVRIYDAVSGELQYRLPGLIAVAVADADGDGAADVLTNASEDPTRTQLDGARLLSLREGTVVERWRDDQARAVAAPGRAVLLVQLPSGERRRLGLESSPTDATGDRDIEIKGTAISALAWTPPELAPVPDFSKVAAVVGPPFPELLVDDLDVDGRNEVLVYRKPGVQVLRLSDGELVEWRQYRSSALPVLADLDGDGRTELTTCTMTPDAEPLVEARIPADDDRTLWQTRFPAPTRTGLPAPRSAYMRTGRFLGYPTPDLYVWAGTPLVRSVALDGETGAMLWEKSEFIDIHRYWGPSVNLASVYDYDGDDKEDLVFTNPDYYCVASGMTGDLFLGPLFPPQIFSQPSQGLYTLPAILEYPDREPTVCLIAGHYFQAAMSIRAEPSWHALPPAGQSRCATEGFLRLGDATWLMGFGRQNGDFACVNVEDGSLRWELPVEASCSDVSACDVDGDGALEFLFGTSHGHLYAVGDADGEPRVVWSADLGTALGGPVPADVNGDGASEILVATSDGYVLVLGPNTDTSSEGEAPG